MTERPTHDGYLLVHFIEDPTATLRRPMDVSDGDNRRYCLSTMESRSDLRHRYHGGCVTRISS